MKPISQLRRVLLLALAFSLFSFNPTNEEEDVKVEIKKNGWSYYLIMVPVNKNLKSKSISVFDYLKTFPGLNKELYMVIKDKIKTIEKSTTIRSNRLPQKPFDKDAQLLKIMRDGIPLGFVSDESSQKLMEVFLSGSSENGVEKWKGKFEKELNRKLDKQLDNNTGAALTLLYTIDESYGQIKNNFIDVFIATKKKNNGLSGKMDEIYIDKMLSDKMPTEGTTRKKEASIWGIVWGAIVDVLNPGGPKDDYGSGGGIRGDCIDNADYCAEYSAYGTAVVNAIYNRLKADKYGGCNFNATPGPDDASNTCYNYFQGVHPDTSFYEALYTDFCRSRAGLMNLVSNVRPDQNCDSYMQFKNRYKTFFESFDACNNPRTICAPDQASIPSLNRVGFHMIGSGAYPLIIGFDLKAIESELFLIAKTL